MRFQGKTILITGAGSGIGEAAARRFGREGGRVVVADIDEPAAQRVAGEIPGALPLHLDVRDENAVLAVFDRTVAEFGAIDAVFNNAGIAGEYMPLHEATLENWRSVMAVNSEGMFLVLRGAIGAMLKTGGGAIVNMASTAGLVATSPRLAAYIYSKSGIIGLTRSAAVDYAKEGIRVNAVAPGQVLTPLIERIIRESSDPAAEMERRANLHPIPGFIDADDVAAAVAFLASDDARRITGVVLPVDAGYVAR